MISGLMDSDKKYFMLFILYIATRRIKKQKNMEDVFFRAVCSRPDCADEIERACKWALSRIEFINKYK